MFQFLEFLINNFKHNFDMNDFYCILRDKIFVKIRLFFI